MLPFSYALRNLFRDPSRLAQTVGGSALVVLLLVAAVALNQGMDRVLATSGSSKNVILMGKGSEESIERSEVHLEAEAAAATSIRGLDSQLGVTAISGEIFYQAPLETESGNVEQALFRGVLESALLVHSTVRVLEGRFPQSGEVMVGHLAHRKLGVDADQTAIGKILKFEDASFKIVGVFEAPSTVLESEVWFDRNDLAAITQRDSLSSITLRMDSAEFDDVEIFAFQQGAKFVIVIGCFDESANLGISLRFAPRPLAFLDFRDQLLCFLFSVHRYSFTENFTWSSRALSRMRRISSSGKV